MDNPLNSWKITNWNLFQTLIYLLLPVVVTFNFYGLYTHKFYWYKFDNFILPAVSLVHLMYLTHLNTKIKDSLPVDFKLQNLEFAAYGVLVIYLFETIDTLSVILDYATINLTLIPEGFLVHGMLVFSLQFALAILTLFSFFIRKNKVGTFNFDHFGENLEGWRQLRDSN